MVYTDLENSTHVYYLVNFTPYENCAIYYFYVAYNFKDWQKNLEKYYIYVSAMCPWF